MISIKFPLTIKEEEEAQIVGELTLFSNTSVVLNRVKLGFYLLIFFSLIKTLILLFLFTKAFKRTLFTPLSALAETTKGLSFDALKDINLFQNEKKENELTVLEKSINTMIENINKSKSEIILSREAAIKAWDSAEKANRIKTELCKLDFD